MPSINWRDDLDAATAEAEDSGRLLMASFQGERDGSIRLAETTYTDDRTVTMVNEHTVPVQLTLDEPEAQEWGVVWTPTVLLIDGTLQLQRHGGHLEAKELQALVYLALAHAALRRGDADAAVRWLKDANDRCRDSGRHDAVLYWLGVATLGSTGSETALRRAWQRLHTLYPDSLWSRAAQAHFQGSTGRHAGGGA